VVLFPFAVLPFTCTSCSLFLACTLFLCSCCLSSLCYFYFSYCPLFSLLWPHNIHLILQTHSAQFLSFRIFFSYFVHLYPVFMLPSFLHWSFHYSQFLPSSFGLFLFSYSITTLFPILCICYPFNFFLNSYTDLFSSLPPLFRSLTPLFCLCLVSCSCSNV
jgi:hypothetical protein